MYYDHTEWERRIREAAAQKGDAETLALSSEEIQSVIREIEKDYPYIQKKMDIGRKKHLNIYSKVQVCSMLCKATKAILEAYTKALQNDWIVKYVFTFSTRCNISYDATLDAFYFPVYTIYDADDIQIDINPTDMAINGYVACQPVEIVELGRDPAKILYTAAEDAWNKIKTTKEIRELISPDEDLTTIDILPYLKR